jgi:hypothetical protein
VHAEGMNAQLNTEAGRIRSFEERLELAQQQATLPPPPPALPTQLNAHDAQVHAKDESVRLLRVSEGEARAALEKLEKEVVALRRRLEVAEEVRAPRVAIGLRWRVPIGLRRGR